MTHTEEAYIKLAGEVLDTCMKIRNKEDNKVYKDNLIKDLRLLSYRHNVSFDVVLDIVFGFDAIIKEMKQLTHARQMAMLN